MLEVRSLTHSLRLHFTIISCSLTPRNFFSTGFEDFFDDPFFRPPMPLLKNFPRPADMILRRSSPCYEINEDDDTFQLAVDVPGVKAGDLNISVERDGRVLRISGQRKVKEENMQSESRFEKSFWLDRSIDASKITANLADGVVTIAAPKTKEAKEVRQVPITENPRVLPATEKVAP